MMGLTLVAVVVAVLHPVAWTDDEMRFAVLPRRPSGSSCSSARSGSARSTRQAVVGGFAATPVRVALLLVLSSLGIYVVFALAGRLGWGPMAAPPGPTDPARRLEPPAPPAEGLAPAGLGARDPGRLGGDLPAGDAARGLRRVVHPVGARRGPPHHLEHGRPATPARRCSS